MNRIEYQSVWGWITATDFFLGGVGSSLFLISFLLTYGKIHEGLGKVGSLLGLLFVIVGLGLLTIEAGRREKLVRVFRKPRSSWLSRGAIFNVIFLVFGGLYVASRWLELGLFGFGIVAGVAAILVATYPGIILQSSSSIPFWNNAVLPILFLAHGIVGANGILSVILFFLPFSLTVLKLITWWELVILVFTAVLLFIHLFTAHSSRLEAKMSLNALLKGEYSAYFKSFIILGLVLPLLIGTYSYFFMNVILAALAGLLALIGVLLLRFVILAVGIYVEVRPYP